MEPKIRKLVEYCQGLYRGENGKELYLMYLGEIQSITPMELVLVEYEQLKLGMTPKELLTVVDKLINVFYKSLSSYDWRRPDPNTFLWDLMQENTGLRSYLDGFKEKIKENALFDLVPDLREFVEVTKTYNAHLLKIENILFPYMERKAERFDGLKIMWSLHDELRILWKTMAKQLEEKHHDSSLIDFDELNINLGRLYFLLYGLAQKQELILFPTATELLTDTELASMREQSVEYEFPFIVAPEIEISGISALGAGLVLGQSEGFDANRFRGLFETPTGHMDFEQLQILLNLLPVDMTLVDENDKVAFFSRPKDRIFPRSVAIIGRDVRNCHPPESVHVVEDILASFKRGEKDEAAFWIQMRGMFIHIQYFAMRNEKGEYRGTLEVSQEISGLRALEGERRLLEW